jgi:enoyl-CoA hydratase
MALKTLKTETRGRVAIITLNRPDALNALNSELLGELRETMAKFGDDEKIGAIVLTGSEKAFAAGADIKEMQPLDYVGAYMNDFFEGWSAVANTRKPVIAAVSGYALGGGCELAMMCDIIIASDTAKFGQPEITLGVIPGMGGTQRLTRAVGKAKAMDLCLTGRFMEAEEAERSGLVARVVTPADDLMATAIKAAEKIAGFLAAGRNDGEGVGQPGRRDDTCGRSSLRAPAVPLAVCDRGPEGRHGCLCREAEGAVQASLRRDRASHAVFGRNNGLAEVFRVDARPDTSYTPAIEWQLLGSPWFFRIPDINATRSARRRFFAGLAILTTERHSWPIQLRRKRRPARSLAAPRSTKPAAHGSAVFFARSKKPSAPATRTQRQQH